MTTNKLTTFVVNLDDRQDRWKFIGENISTEYLDIQRFSAVDGRNKKPEEFDNYNPEDALKYFGRVLSSSELGCYMSHVKLAQKIVDLGVPYAFVLEDDAEPQGDIDAKLIEMISLLQDKFNGAWDVVNCGKEARHLSRPIYGSPLEWAPYFPLNMHAILWSQEGARHFLNECYPIKAPVDHLLRKFCAHNGRGFATRPPVFVQIEGQSDIAQTRKSHKKGFHYVWREFSRQNKIYLHAIKNILLRSHLYRRDND